MSNRLVRCPECKKYHYPYQLQVDIDEDGYFNLTCPCGHIILTTEFEEMLDEYKVTMIDERDIG